MAVTYVVYIEPDVHAARKILPGNIRQRMGRIIHALATEPRPETSRSLETPNITLPEHVEIRRYRVDHWRVVYAVNDAEHWVWVLGIYRRPPYDYTDIAKLIERLP